MLRRIFIVICCGAVLIRTLSSAGAQTVADSKPSHSNVETIVCIRHGEKPLLGLGQLTCQGLNRALALPGVLLAKFGKPNSIFAPDPNQLAHDPGGEFCYLRPIATIEPTAIACGLPVNTRFGFKDIAALKQELTKPAYENATVFVAWEHRYLDDFVRDLVGSFGGDRSQVPEWPGSDYDSIFVVRLTHRDAKITATFSRDAEDLNNLSSDCPGSQKR